MCLKSPSKWPENRIKTSPMSPSHPLTGQLFPSILTLMLYSLPMYFTISGTKRMLTKAGFTQQEIRFTIFFPQFLSFLIPHEKYLSKLPLGAHYYFAVQRTHD